VQRVETSVVFNRRQQHVMPLPPSDARPGTRAK
jgi:hypothetical protein